MDQTIENGKIKKMVYNINQVRRYKIFILSYLGYLPTLTFQSTESLFSDLPCFFILIGDSRKREEVKFI